MGDNEGITLALSLTLTLTMAPAVALTLSGIGGPTCGVGGVNRTKLLVFVACGMGATTLYNSFALDQVPPTLIKPHAWQPCLPCMCVWKYAPPPRPYP